MRTIRIIPFLCILAVAGAAGKTGASHPQWGALEPGPYRVGFRAMEAVDESRAIAARHRYDGTVNPNPTARPVRIFVWYPTGEPNDKLLPARFYRQMSAGLDATADEVARFVDSERSLLARITGHQFSAATWDSLMSIPTAAYLNAQPAPGPFPVIIGAADARRNNVLFEYLASHGYIVAMTPTQGHFTRESLAFTPNPVSIQTVVQDLQFVYEFLHVYQSVDLNRVGMWAFSSTSIYSFEFQARNMAAAALLHVEGWEGFERGREILEESLFYDPAAIRVPYMLLRKASEEANPAYANDSTVFDDLRYANRYRVLLEGMAHGDFNSMRAVVTATPDLRARYERACRLTLAFYDTHLNQGAGARLDGEVKSLASMLDQGVADSSLTYTHVAAAVAPPTVAEFAAAFEAGGEAQRKAIARADNILQGGGTLPYPAHILNRFGYKLMGDRTADAVQVFVVATRVYPNSANAWDSLSDGLEALGDVEGARDAVVRAQELVAADTLLTDESRARLEATLAAKLERLNQAETSPTESP